MSDAEHPQLERQSAAWPGPILASTAIALVFALALYRVGTFDTFFHLATGRLILEQGSVPTTDPFSFTFRGAVWHNHSWGYQVLIAQLHAWFGFSALSVLQAVLASLAAVMALLSVHGRGALVPWAAALLVLGFAAYREMLESRPHMLGFACLAAVTQLALRAYRTRRLALLLWIVPIDLVWISAHGSHLLVFFVLGAAVLVSAWARDRELLVGFGATLAGVSVATWLVAPEAFELGGQHVSSAFLESHVHEWQPVSLGLLLHTVQGWTFSAFAVLSLVGAWLLLLKRRSDLAPHALTFACVLLVGFLALASTSARMMGLFVLAAASVWLPFCAHALAAAWERARLSPARASRLAALLATLAMLGVSVASFTGQSAFRFGAGLMHERLPAGALAHMRENAAPKRLYNAYNYGGYLIWERFPSAGVFVDGRAITVYPASFLAEFEHAYRDPRSFEALARHFAIDGVLLPTRSAKARSLLAYLRAHPRFEETYTDDVASVFQLRSAADEGP